DWPGEWRGPANPPECKPWYWPAPVRAAVAAGWGFRACNRFGEWTLPHSRSVPPAAPAVNAACPASSPENSRAGRIASESVTVQTFFGRSRRLATETQRTHREENDNCT